MDNILEIKNLNVGFDIEDNFYFALNDINLTFEKGKIHAIAGESGCGKSVLINTILKLLPKNSRIKSGEILFKDQDLLKLKEKEIRKIRGNSISLIPQDPFMSLNPLYTIENQLLEVPSIKDRENKINIIKGALEEVKIKNIDTVFEIGINQFSYVLDGHIFYSHATLNEFIHIPFPLWLILTQ